jgi:DNA-binding PucR family transcriptional regulator
VVVGLGDPQPDLSYIRESHRQAARAARVAQLVAGADPVAEWRHLGVFRTLTSIPTDQLDSAALDPRVRAILDADDPSLVTTLEAYLDCGCDVKHTCGLLNVHRGTVYYRLQKAESLSGLDLGDGMDRLALHLGVKIARLAGLLTT